MLITSEKTITTSQPVTNIMGLPPSQGVWFSQSQIFIKADTKIRTYPQVHHCSYSIHFSRSLVSKTLLKNFPPPILKYY